MPNNDFLTSDQVQLLKDKKWTVKPNGFQLNILKEDYKQSEWEQVCSIVGCTPQSNEITIVAFGYINK